MVNTKAIDAVISTANSQVGYREGENNWNKYAADLDPLRVTNGNMQNQPWCGMFTLWVFDKCFGVDKALAMLCSPKPTGIPLCSAGAGYFKSAGRWSNKPSLGAIVFFFVSGGINHEGIVTAIDGDTITTVEGNSSDMVSRRTYKIGSPQIAGYGIPKWEVVTSGSNGTTTKPTVTGLPMLQSGDKGEAVRAAQLLLIGRGFSCGTDGADGDFGYNTHNATINFQRENVLEIDGIIGQATWSKLLGL